MPTETTTTETQPAAGMRDALLDIAAAANDALYTSQSSPEATEKAYAEALDLIRKRVHPDTFFTPIGLLPDLPAPVMHRSCFDALAEDYGLRLQLFRYGKSRKLVGVRRTQPNNPHNEHLYEVTDDHEGHLDFMRDGTWIATLTMGVQRGSTNSILCSILRNILKESARRNLVHKRARARARAAAAEHLLAPVNPPMDIPPRPGLPEDDE